jgi:hypothetical protein
MQVMLSVPVPSDIVMSPLAIPWLKRSSIINEVSPLTLSFLLERPSDFDFYPNLVGEAPKLDFLAKSNLLFARPILDGEANVPFFGPFSLRLRTNLTAYSLVKQSQIPSQATIKKSCSGFNSTFLTSGNEVT